MVLGLSLKMVLSYFSNPFQYRATSFHYKFLNLILAVQNAPQASRRLADAAVLRVLLHLGQREAGLVHAAHGGEGRGLRVPHVHPLLKVEPAQDLGFCTWLLDKNLYSINFLSNRSCNYHLKIKISRKK